MIKTLIIDDEPLAAGIVQEFLANFPQFEILGICQNGFQGLKSIQEHEPDLIFLDVQMPKITGFEMLELLDEPPAVIFTTAFDQFALLAEAFFSGAFYSSNRKVPGSAGSEK